MTPQEQIEFERVKREVTQLKEQVAWLDKRMVEVQQHINAILKQAGMRGGFAR